MRNVAFIGLGKMGAPMAAALVAAGNAVRGFDLVPELRAAAGLHGVAAVDSTAAAVATADTVITMLPAASHVLVAWSEILPLARPGTLFIDSSTIDIAAARALHEQAKTAGFLSLDAPVSGGTGGAKAASLTFMCGGEPEAFAAARPILASMGRKIIHCGGAGAGQAAKICNNMMLGATMIVTAEAFVLAEKLGLAADALFEVASTSSGQSWSLTSYCPVPGPVPASPANNGFKPGFSVDLMLKDLKLAQEAAAGCGAAVPMGSTAAQLYALYAAAGEGGADFSGIIRMLRGRAAGDLPAADDSP